MVVWPKVPPAREGRGGSKYHPDYPPVGGVVKISWSGRRYYPPVGGGSMRNLDVLGDEIYKFSDFEVLPPRRGGSRGGTF